MSLQVKQLKMSGNGPRIRARVADAHAHIDMKLYAENRIDPAGLKGIMENLDRPQKSSTEDAYVTAEAFADGFEDELGQCLPKAGVRVKAGLPSARTECSIFEVEAKLPNACAGAEASVQYLGAQAYLKAEIGSVSASAGPVKAKLGLAVDTGVGISVLGVEAQVLGTGFSIGRRTSVSLFGSELEVRLW